LFRVIRISESLNRILNQNYLRISNWCKQSVIHEVSLCVNFKLYLHIYIIHTKEKEVHLYFGHPIQQPTLKLWVLNFKSATQIKNWWNLKKIKQNIWWILDPSPFLGKHVLWSENKQKCNIFQYLWKDLYIDGQKFECWISNPKNSELLNHLDVEKDISKSYNKSHPTRTFSTLLVCLAPKSNWIMKY
jgi:hypothetical protein